MNASQISVNLHGIHPSEIGPHAGRFCVALHNESLGIADTAWQALEDAGHTGETQDFEVWLWHSAQWPFVKPIIAMDGEQIGYLFKF